MAPPCRSIEPPPRSGPAGAAVIVASGIILSVGAFCKTPSVWLALFSLIPLVLSALVRATQAFHFVLFTAVFALAPLAYPSLGEWPFTLLIPVSLSGLAMLLFPPTRRTLYWMKPGRVSGRMVLVALAVCAVSGLALYAWNRALEPDLAVHLRHFPAMPIWLVPVAGIAFSAGNAVVEEAAYRGIIMQAFESAWGPHVSALLAQAWLFAAIHFLKGFPNGWWGVAMTFVYGIVLGGMRRLSRGLLVPWLAHAFADAVVFTIVASQALSKA